MAIFPPATSGTSGSKSGIFDLILEKISHSQTASWKIVGSLTHRCKGNKKDLVSNDLRYS